MEYLNGKAKMDQLMTIKCIALTVILVVQAVSAAAVTSCPVINVCSPSCEDCNTDVFVDRTSEFLCYVNSSEADINIMWDVVGDSNGTMILNQTVQHGNTNHTWSASRTITYKPIRCDTQIILRCLAFWETPVPSTTNKTIYVNAPCLSTITSITTEENQIPTGNVVVPVVVIILIILIMLGCVMLWIMRRKSRRTGFTDHYEELSMNDIPGTFSKTASQPKKISKQTAKKLLFDCLAKSYKRLCYVNPLPWDDPIPIAILYTDCQCVIRSGKDDVLKEAHIDSSRILSSNEFQFDHHRVLLVADLGFGKTTFTKHKLNEWINSKTKDYILIYIQLKDVKNETLLSDAVLDLLPPGSGLTGYDIEAVLETEKSLVLLDGLDELAMSAENAIDARKVRGITYLPNTRNTLLPKQTIKHLLKNDITNAQMKVWVTSREIDFSSMPFSPPFTKVALTGFSNEQINTYISNACRFYTESYKQSVSKISQQRDNTDNVDEISEQTNLLEKIEANITNHESLQSETGTDSGSNSYSNNQADFEKQVQGHLNNNDISRDFSNTPLLLIMIIHIVASKLSNPLGEFKDVNITRLTSIIQFVIACLESRFVKKMTDLTIDENIKKIKYKLSKLAYVKRMHANWNTAENWKSIIGKKDLDTALSIGLLKPSKEVTGDPTIEFFDGIEFYHEYFQEFLAAQHVPTNAEEEQMLLEFTKSRGDESTVRLFQFMFGCNHPKVEQIFEALLNAQEMWNNLIDCIYEVTNKEQASNMAMKISKKAKALGKAPGINVKYIDRKHHQLALASFCSLCIDSQIKLRQIIFREDHSIAFIRWLTLPRLQRLEFLDLVLNEDSFVSIIESVANRTAPEVLQFVGCSLPKTFSTESKKRMKNATIDKKIKIYKKKKKAQNDLTICALKPEKGEWGKKWFPEGQ